MYFTVIAKRYNQFLVDRLLIDKRILIEILMSYGHCQTSRAELVEVHLQYSGDFRN